MPIIKSAKKRVRQSEKRRKRNLVISRGYKALIKEVKSLADDGKHKEARELYPQAQKAIDVADKKNILHGNTAARKKSNLVKYLKAAAGVR